MNFANTTKAMAVAMLMLSGCATVQPTPPSVAERCPAAAAPRITPEMSMNARRTAEALLQEAVRGKVWTVKHRVSLLQTLPNMNECDRIAAMQSVAQSTNRGELKFEEGAFPPF